MTDAITIRRNELETIPWSTYQLAVREFVEHGQGSVAVDAVAGSGKSTTIEWLVLSGAMRGKILVCAFNKHIATPMKALLKPAPNCEVSTINAHGNRTVKFHANRKDWDYLDGRKYTNYVRDELRAASRGSTDVARAISDHWPSSAIGKLISLARNTLSARMSASRRVVLDRTAYESLCANYDIEIPVVMDEWALNCVNRCLQRGLDEWRQVIDFGDQNWLPNILDQRPMQYDWVVVDEAQDLNANQLEYVMRCLKPNTGRLLICGDPYQAMYGFAGAMPDSFDRAVQRSNATQLPLSICYRCPTSHLNEAREIVPHIEAGPAAIEGIRDSANWSNLHTNWTYGDVVMCRLNAPLLELAYDQISKGVGAKIRGGDLGTQLKGDVRKIGKRPGFRYPQFARFADELCSERVNEILRKNGNDLEDMAIQRTRDRHACVMIIHDNCPQATSTDSLEQAIDNLFDERNATVLLSTVHKSKGTEANRIFLLQPDLMPFWAAQFGPEWQQQQEMNIKYVALTRAKKAMYDIIDDREAMV